MTILICVFHFWYLNTHSFYCTFNYSNNILYSHCCF